MQNYNDLCIQIPSKHLFPNLEYAVPKKELFMVLLYLGMCSLCQRTRLQKSINIKISFCKIEISFKSSTRLANFFRFKDKILLCLRSNILYKFTCGRCNAAYYDETYRHLKVRVGEHSSISPLMNKRPKSKKPTAVKDHVLIWDQPVSFDAFKVLVFVTQSSI